MQLHLKTKRYRVTGSACVLTSLPLLSQVSVSKLFKACVYQDKLKQIFINLSLGLRSIGFGAKRAGVSPGGPHKKRTGVSPAIKSQSLINNQPFHKCLQKISFVLLLFFCLKLVKLYKSVFQVPIMIILFDKMAKTYRFIYIVSV